MTFELWFGICKERGKDGLMQKHNKPQALRGKSSYGQEIEQRSEWLEYTE